jgi:hypothetical protein
MPAHGVAVGDDALGGHQHARPGGASVTPHKQANAQPVEGRRAGDEPRQAPRLVHGQGVHWVYDQRLDAALAGLTRPRAVVQRRIDKAFRFAAAGAGGNQGVRRHPIADQTLPGLALVRVGGAFGLEAAEKIPAGAVMLEGQADLQVRPFHPGRLVIDEAAHDPMEEAIGRLETGDQELFDALLNVARQQRGEHGFTPFEGHYGK